MLHNRNDMNNPLNVTLHQSCELKREAFAGTGIKCSSCRKTGNKKIKKAVLTQGD